MIYTSTGFFNTGSSAVTDLLRECEGISNKGVYEVRFIYDPYGISDLEYNLIENPNRHNSSHAIKKFKKQMYMLDHVWFVKRYSKYLGEGFTKLVDQYIDEISECEYKGHWHYDVYERGNLFYILSRSYSKLTSRLPGKGGGQDIGTYRDTAYVPKYDEDDFLRATRKFIYGFIDIINKEHAENIILDQLLPPSNLERYLRYFDRENTRVSVVNRDPRDCFFINKAFWPKSEQSKDVELFCKWYRYTREIYYKDPTPPEVIDIMFEDLVYRYDETRLKIFKHMNIDPARHTDQYHYLDPKKSVANTQVWRFFPECEKEKAYIESHLPEYLYDYPYKIDVPKSEMFDE